MAVATEQQLNNRLRSIEGHVRGIERMVGEGAYCVDILKQTLAVQRALERFNSLILDRHLNSCVTRVIREGDPEARQRAIDEIVDVFQAKAKV